MGALRPELLELADFWEARGDHTEAARLRVSARRASRCPHCHGGVRLELSINFLVCKRCSEILYVNELV